MTKLSVNINKVATLRNARGGEEPDVIRFAEKCYEYGAEGITIHPRPDQRHIRYSDVEALSQLFPRENCEFNIEGYPNEKFIDLVLQYKPTQVTLVPDPPNVLTSDSGWDTKSQFDFLKPIISKFKKENIRVSLFMETNEQLISLCKELGVDRVEFYTGHYAHEYHLNPKSAIKNYIKAYQHCESIGIGVNAGHDLNLENLRYFKENLPNCLEVSIGHYLVSDCLYYGLQNVIPMYQRLLV